MIFFSSSKCYSPNFEVFDIFHFFLQFEACDRLAQWILLLDGQPPQVSPLKISASKSLFEGSSKDVDSNQPTNQPRDRAAEDRCICTTKFWHTAAYVSHNSSHPCQMLCWKFKLPLANTSVNYPYFWRLKTKTKN